MKELLEIQNKLKVPKTLYNSFGEYYYRSAESIMEAVKPLLYETKCTLVLSDEVVAINNNAYVKSTATLTNEKGEKEICSAYAMELYPKKKMAEAQLTGASSSYSRKYCLGGMFLLDDTKDADHESTQTPQTSQPAKDPKAEMVKQILGDKEYTIQCKLAGKVMLKDKKMTFQSEDGKNFYTFSTTIATKAKEAITKDIVISLTYTNKGKFGLEATDIQEVF